MEKERNNNGNTILLTVIGVATLLVALVGATFAYFSATINNEQQESIMMQTATPVGLKYKGGTVALNNTIPGESNEGTFTIENPSTVGESDTPNKVNQTYTLKLVVDKNTLDTTWKNNENPSQTAPEGAAEKLADQLRVTITATTNGTNTVQTINGGNYYNLTTVRDTAQPLAVVTDQQINVGETHTYTVKIEFIDLDIPQDAAQGKEFAAHIEISDTRSVKEA